MSTTGGYLLGYSEGQCTRCGTIIYRRTLFRPAKPVPINRVEGDHAIVDLSFEHITYYEYREHVGYEAAYIPDSPPLKYCPGCGGAFRDTHPDL